jgi:hypothetical protein
MTMRPRGIRFPSSARRWGTRRCHGLRLHNDESTRHEPTVDHPVTGKPVAFGSDIGSDIGSASDHVPAPIHLLVMTPQTTVDGGICSVDRLPCGRWLRTLQNAVAVGPRSAA